MIGIDITKISRFTLPLEKYNKKFNTNFTSAVDVAKCWACYEAIIKAEGKSFKIKDINIVFLPNKAPAVVDPKKILKGKYYLSLSHEDDIIVAVALFKGHYNGKRKD